MKSIHRSISSIAVGLSGGVDSAVAALRLKEQGFDITAIFMKNWEEDDNDHCMAAKDLIDVTLVCEHLGIPLHTVNLASEYWERVFCRSLDGYQRGLTPNPDILCNREIKFQEFHLFAMDLGADQIATGHYARTTHINGEPVLLKARDESKDQSYFLYAIEKVALTRAIFPLGELLKIEVRGLAEAAGLHIAQKRDSTGICFIGKRPFRDFLARFIPHQPGPIKTTEGEVIGIHQGVGFYTIGQRQGLGIGGCKTGTGDAWYVAAKEAGKNTLIVVQGRRHPALYATHIQADEIHWINDQSPKYPFTCRAKVRYRQREQPCLVSYIDAENIEINFKEPQWATTPGQAVVFYDGDICLGGATISHTWNTL